MPPGPSLRMPAHATEATPGSSRSSSTTASTTPTRRHPSDAGTWPARNDPFSSYRAGFEVRTYRLCQRVLMFHHFPGEPGVGRDCLVRSTDFTYSRRSRSHRRPQPRLHLPARRSRRPATAATTAATTSAACRPSSSSTPSPSCRTRWRRSIRRAWKTSPSAWTAAPTAGPTCTAKAFPASSPSRPAPGSTSAT